MVYRIRRVCNRSTLMNLLIEWSVSKVEFVEFFGYTEGNYGGPECVQVSPPKFYPWQDGFPETAHAGPLNRVQLLRGSSSEVVHVILLLSSASKAFRNHESLTSIMRREQERLRIHTEHIERKKYDYYEVLLKWHAKRDGYIERFRDAVYNLPKWLSSRTGAPEHEIRNILEGPVGVGLDHCLRYTTIGNGGMAHDGACAKRAVKQIYGYLSMPIEHDLRAQRVVVKPTQEEIQRAEIVLRGDWRALYFLAAALYNINNGVVHNNIHRVFDQFTYLVVNSWDFSSFVEKLGTRRIFYGAAGPDATKLDM